MSIKEDLVYCNTCKKYTMQLLLEENENLAIKSRDSLFQKFQCNTCKRTNERLLQYCRNCYKHTSQSLIEENPSSFAEMIDQTFRCNTCGKINETSRDTDEVIKRWLNAKDEEGGITCGYCMCRKKQELINKQPSKYWPERDLTTYKCKTCGTINYGSLIRTDIP